MKHGAIHILNDGLRGLSHDDISGQLVSRFEKAFDQAEEMEKKTGEETTIVLQGETKKIELSPETVAKIKSSIRQWRQVNS